MLAAPKHSHRAARRGPSVIALIAVLVLVLVAGGVGYAVWRDDSAGCSERVVTVAVDPAIVATVEEVSGGLRNADPCVEVTVEGRLPREVAELITSPGSEGPTASDLPDVWIPDARYWIESVAANPEGKDRISDEDHPVIATTPIVVAVQTAKATVFNWPANQPSWKDAQTSTTNNWDLAMPQPIDDTVGLAGLFDGADDIAQLADRVEVPDAGTSWVEMLSTAEFDAALASESDVIVANKVGGELVAGYDPDVGALLEYSFVRLIHEGAAPEEDVAVLRAALSSDAAQQRIRRAGFRDADGMLDSSFERGDGVLGDSEPPEALAIAVDQVAPALNRWQEAVGDSG
jgi:hypothetical protein